MTDNKLIESYLGINHFLIATRIFIIEKSAKNVLKILNKIVNEGKPMKFKKVFWSE